MSTTKRLREFSRGNRESFPEDINMYVDGSFDILHAGHIEILKKAKALGTYLIVGVHDDETVNKHKGKLSLKVFTKFI